MPTKCKPRVSAHAEMIVDNGCESHACSCWSHSLHLGALMRRLALASASSSACHATAALLGCTVRTASSTYARKSVSGGMCGAAKSVHRKRASANKEVDSGSP
eukprot:3527952-Amphidinium_carterae.1